MQKNTYTKKGKKGKHGIKIDKICLLLIKPGMVLIALNL